MDDRRSSGRAKRQKPIEEGSWDCSVCTFQNPTEAYKCEMCDVRKGTSTRKPRLNAQIAAQQVAQQYVPPPQKKERPFKSEDYMNESSNDSCDVRTISNTNSLSLEPHTNLTGNTFIVKKEKNHSHSTKKSSRSTPRIDRSSAETMSVTVGNVTVVITDYKAKLEKKTSSTSADMHQNVTSDSSDCSVLSGINRHAEEFVGNGSNH
ncbi:RING1 and YY1-binding protein A-like [Ostrea edulis]|uniref:RING1 and YY1-binding protein A-like n=1 Tax=Ostrea edulis TaxID=37623 RepID=UPI0020943217|nr:RING1 and YY1-binding protein A-like [Ostrea edulis]